MTASSPDGHGRPSVLERYMDRADIAEMRRIPGLLDAMGKALDAAHTDGMWEGGQSVAIGFIILIGLVVIVRGLLKR